MERAVLADRLVREAAHLGQIEHAGPQAPGHRPPAFRTQIERQKKTDTDPKKNTQNHTQKDEPRPPS